MREGGENGAAGPYTPMTEPDADTIEPFVAATIHSGGQMMIMISSMGQAIEESPNHEAGSNPIDDELIPILTPRLLERDDVPRAEDLEAATRVLHWCTEAFAQDVFGSEPGRPHSTWVPEVRARVRRMDDDAERPEPGPMPEELDFLGNGYREAG